MLARLKILMVIFSIMIVATSKGIIIIEREGECPILPIVILCNSC